MNSKQIRQFLIHHSDKFLLGGALAAMGGACVASWKGGAKASRIIEEESRDAAREGKDFTKLDAVRATWREWTPPLVLYSAAIAASIESTRINYKRTAILASSLEASKLALMKLEDKTLETVGKNKFSQIKQSLAEDEIKAVPMTEENTIKTGKGEDLFFDPKSGRYFLSTLDAVEAARVKTNAKLMDEMYVSLNEFYYELGLPAIDLGELVQWDVNHSRLIDITPVGGISESGKPCIVLTYDVIPRRHA